MIPVDPLVGLRTPYARHIEDRVHRHAEAARQLGEKVPLCGIHLDRTTTVRQEMALIAPAVLCPRCVEAARRWYAASYFVTFDRVQRHRLLAALTHDLKAAT